MLPWIIAFIAIDLVVTLLVVRRLLARRVAGSKPAGGAESSASLPSSKQLLDFTQAVHPRIGEIVAANWSGDPDSLPAALGQAVVEVERESRNYGLALDHDMLKRLVETSLARHGVIPVSQLREAFKKAA